MKRFSIQLPEQLYRETKRIAADYEMSFSEVGRRSLERTLPAYPPKTAAEWWLPEPIHLELRYPIDDEWALLGNDPDYRPRRLPRPAGRDPNDQTTPANDRPAIPPTP